MFKLFLHEHQLPLMFAHRDNPNEQKSEIPTCMGPKAIISIPILCNFQDEWLLILFLPLLKRPAYQ